MKTYQDNIPKNRAKYRRKILLYVVMTLLATTILFYWYIQPIKINAKARLDCIYMSYACGDCASQYNVVSADQTTITSYPVIGLDAYLEFENEALKDRFTNKVGDCPRCYRYELFGQLFRFRNQQDLLVKIDSFELAEIPGMLEDHSKTMESLRRMDTSQPH